MTRLSLPDPNVNDATLTEPMPKRVAPAPPPLRVAYVLQNAGNRLSADIGPAILIKHTLRGLGRFGHTVHVYRLRGRTVGMLSDLNRMSGWQSTPLGWSGTTPFKLFESAVRRVQVELNLPHLAVFDAYRFYEACLRFLPGYSLCHEYGGLFSLGAAIACKRLGVPHVLTVEADPFLENEVKGTPIRGLRGWIARREANLVYGLADRILTVSEQAKSHFVRSWNVAADKIAVMPNGVDTDHFHPDHDPGPIREELGLGPGPVVVFVGGFQSWHGVEGLVHSFRQVVEVVPNATLLLIGDGPTRPSVMAQVEEFGLGGSVVFTGMIPQKRVPEFLAVADIAVLPYPPLPEELWFSPLKLYEYMAAGKAIVASRAGQIADVIADRETGILVDPGDLTGLGTAIIRLIENPDERDRLGRTARREAVENHSWDRYVIRLEKVYRSVMKGFR